MGIGRGVKRVVKPLVNVRAWMDTDSLGSNAVGIVRMIKLYFVPSSVDSVRRESFAEAKQRFQLEDKTISAMQRTFGRMALVFSVITLMACVYTVYLFLYGTWSAILVALALSTLAAVLAFRYHFWWFQIRSRTLGYTFKEWLHKGLLSGGKR